jgi:uncharacterized protein (UPF0332 family)
MTASKKQRLKDARKSFDLAKAQLDQAQIDWWEPANPASCVTNTFYAYENAVTAAMIAVGRKRSRRHPEKAAIAKQLYDDNKLKTDVSDRLNELNDARKDVQYGESGHHVTQLNLEELVSGLERFIDEVDDLLHNLEQA